MGRDFGSWARKKKNQWDPFLHDLSVSLLKDDVGRDFGSWVRKKNLQDSFSITSMCPL